MGYGEQWERAAERYGLEVTERWKAKNRPSHLEGYVEGTPLEIWREFTGGGGNGGSTHYTVYKTAYDSSIRLEGSNSSMFSERIQRRLVRWRVPPAGEWTTTIQNSGRCLKLRASEPGFDEWLTPQRRSALEKLTALKASIEGKQVIVRRRGLKINEAVLLDLIEATKQLDDPGAEAEPPS